ncbi:MAG: aminotransferase class V-fold PLP-dependent enzyme [Spirochaetales bacterium]|nr:aminotransferase class V-fold PLP-dependent enzyme [Spirochaetales bacterium]
MLRPEVTFLNHGSFGACPKQVFEVFQNWQRELELQPADFFQRKSRALLDEARAAMALYIGAEEDSVIFVTNASIGLNIIARSLDLKPGDEVLSTDQEYGSLVHTWDLVCKMRGAKYVPMQVDFPITSEEEVVEAIWSGVTDRTKVLFLSHITSSTALKFPVERLIEKARERDILTIIDGAHAPGQIPLDMRTIGADFYVGNCHKWMMAPKSVGFLYARKEVHDLLVPQVGGKARKLSGSSQLVAEHQYNGTRDISAMLAVPETIRFMKDNDWPAVRQESFDSLIYARKQMQAITGLPHVLPESKKWFAQMTILPIPPVDGPEFRNQLWEKYQIEIPVTAKDDHKFLRISLQGYNSRADVDKLADSVTELLTSSPL